MSKKKIGKLEKGANKVNRNFIVEKANQGMQESQGKQNTGTRLIKKRSNFCGIEYEKVLLEDPDKSEKENRYHCFVHYLISDDKQTLNIASFVSNGKAGEGSIVLLNLLNHLIKTEELDPSATIVLTPDAEAASFFVTKNITIDQKKLEEFYNSISLNKRDDVEDDPKFYGNVGQVIDALNKRIKSPELSELSVFQPSMLEPSILKSSEGGKRTRKYRKIKTRTYKKSGSKTRSSPQN
jgi:hypothetical protein